MSQKVSVDRIEQFNKDRALLPYDDVEIAKGMGIDKSNYSSYVNGRLAITNTFLKKFYKAFHDQLIKLEKVSAKEELTVLQELTICIEQLSSKVERQGELLQQFIIRQEKFAQELTTHSLV